MSNLSVFSFNSNEVRTFADSHNEMWFCANDVCAVLGYANPRRTVDLHCKPKGCTKLVHGVSTGKKANGEDAIQNVEMTYINEPNLYRLIVKSRKPEAEAFEEHVMEVILPAIRKTGSYSLASAPEKPTKKALPNGLTLDQQDAIKALVKARAEALPSDKRAKATITMWSSVKSKFGKTYKEVEPEEYLNVIALIARVPLEGEYIPAGTPEPKKLTEPTPEPMPQSELSRNAVVIEKMIYNLVPDQVKEIFTTLVKMNHNNMQILSMFTQRDIINA